MKSKNDLVKGIDQLIAHAESELRQLRAARDELTKEKPKRRRNSTSPEQPGPRSTDGIKVTGDFAEAVTQILANLGGAARRRVMDDELKRLVVARGVEWDYDRLIAMGKTGQVVVHDEEPHGFSYNLPEVSK